MSEHMSQGPHSWETLNPNNHPATNTNENGEVVSHNRDTTRNTEAGTNVPTEFVAKGDIYRDNTFLRAVEFEGFGVPRKLNNPNPEQPNKANQHVA